MVETGVMCIVIDVSDIINFVECSVYGVGQFSC